MKKSGSSVWVLFKDPIRVTRGFVRTVWVFFFHLHPLETLFLDSLFTWHSLVLYWNARIVLTSEKFVLILTKKYGFIDGTHTLEIPLKTLSIMQYRGPGAFSYIVAKIIKAKPEWTSDFVFYVTTLYKNNEDDFYVFLRWMGIHDPYAAMQFTDVFNRNEEFARQRVLCTIPSEII